MFRVVTYAVLYVHLSYCVVIVLVLLLAFSFLWGWLLLFLISSHDGVLLATGGTAGKVRIWDYATRQQLSSALSHSARINSIAFSPDDKQVVSVGDDGSVVVWYIF